MYDSILKRKEKLKPISTKQGNRFFKGFLEPCSYFASSNLLLPLLFKSIFSSHDSLDLFYNKKDLILRKGQNQIFQCALYKKKHNEFLFSFPHWEAYPFPDKPYRSCTIAFIDHRFQTRKSGIL